MSEVLVVSMIQFADEAVDIRWSVPATEEK